jgi:adenylate kinase
MKYKTYLLFGAPGSGKGTQGKVLGAIPGFVHVASGDLFRGLDPKSELGKTFREYADRGQLMPDDFTVRLWADHMQRLVAAGKFKPERDCLVLDGIPRNVKQAEMMKDLVEVVKLIHLSAGKTLDEMVKRLKLRAAKEGRTDDTKEDVIRKRMEVYEKETSPLLRYYLAQLHAEIDALQTPVEVCRDIMTAVSASQSHN